MQQTDRLALELYEATDNANLLDGYNASMRKLDTRDGEVSTLITAAATAASAAGTAAASAQTDATAAGTAAAAAGTAAAAAQTDATAALTALGGVRFEFIKDSDKGTKWNTVSSTYLTAASTTFEAVIIEDRTSHDCIMIAHVGVAWSSTGTIAAEQTQQVLELTDYRFVTGYAELFDAYSLLDVAQAARFYFGQDSVNHTHLILNNIKQVTANLSSPLSGTIVAKVERVS